MLAQGQISKSLISRHALVRSLNRNRGKGFVSLCSGLDYVVLLASNGCKMINAVIKTAVFLPKFVFITQSNWLIIVYNQISIDRFSKKNQENGTFYVIFYCDFFSYYCKCIYFVS